MVWERISLLNTPQAQRDSLAEQLGLERQAAPPDAPLNNKLSASDENANALSEEEPKAFTIPSLPAFLFAKVFAQQDLEQQDNDVELIPAGAKLLESEGSYRFPCAPKLAEPKHLLPLLQKVLFSTSHTSAIDVDKLVKLLANANLPPKLPKQQQQGWPARLDILVDNSASQQVFWQDFYALAHALLNQLGKERVRILRLKQCDEAEQPRVANAALLLSGARFKNLPYPLYQQLKHYKDYWHLNPSMQLHDMAARTLAWPLQSQPIHAEHNGSLKGIDLAMASLAALCLVDTHLLRKLRQHLYWGGAGIEADIWNHDHIEYVGLGIRLKASAKNDYERLYRQHLVPDQAYLRALEAIVTLHVAGTYKGLRYLQQFSFDVLAKRSQEQSADDEAWRYMKQLSQSVQSGDKDRIPQCQTYFHALPNCIYDNTRLDEISYNLAYNAYGHDVPSEGYAKNFDPNKLPKTTDSTTERKSITWLLHQQSSGKLFIQPEPNYRPIPPFIAQITAYENEPLRLISHNSQQIISKPTTIELSDNTLQLKTRQQQLSIGSITRPGWASEIGYTAAGVLYAKIIDDGNEREVHCNLQTGQWLWPAPFGEDEYGLYKDLNLHGQSQRFRWIAPGEFLMGSPEDEVERSPKTETQHTVQISQGFWLAETTVSQALWRVLMGNDRSRFKGKDLPAERVSWLDCQKLIERANTLLKAENLSLPTEAQWEYACRAGTQTPFSTGENITTDQANYDGNYPYANFPKGEYRQKTVPVKYFAPNPWGLYQMHGNVWEWCVDEWQAALAQAGDTRIDPVVGNISSNEDVERVLRGGAWGSHGRDCRSAYRFRDHAGGRGDSFGLRLALGHELKAGVASTAPSRRDGDKPSKKSKKAQTQRRERR